MEVFNLKRLNLTEISLTSFVLQHDLEIQRDSQFIKKIHQCMPRLHIVRDITIQTCS